MTEPVYIARCPEHGLQGERSECYECGGAVEQVPMIPVEGALTEGMVEAEVAWWRAERDRHQFRAERAEAELADLRAGRQHTEAPPNPQIRRRKRGGDAR